MTPPRSNAPAVITAIGLVVLLLGVWPNWWFKGKPKIDLPDRDESSYSDYDSDFGDRMNFEFEFGLREVASCMGDACGSADYDALTAQLSAVDRYTDDDDRRGDGGRGQLKRFVWAGRVAFYSGMFAAIGLLLSLLLWAMRQRLPFSLPAVSGALAVVAAIAGTIAFFTKPVIPGLDGLMQFELQMGLGYPLCLLGAGIAAAGAFHLHKEERGFAPFGGGAPAYAQPYYGSQPYQQPYAGGPAMQVSPACPRCSAPTIFVVEHQRYFCSSCRAYL